MNDHQTKIEELDGGLQVEKKLWIKELGVMCVLLGLVVIREVYLNEWFNFGV